MGGWDFSLVTMLVIHAVCTVSSQHLAGGEPFTAFPGMSRVQLTGQCWRVGQLLAWASFGHHHHCCSGLLAVAFAPQTLASLLSLPLFPAIAPAAGIASIDLARSMLQLMPNTYVLVVSTENITQVQL